MSEKVGQFPYSWGVISEDCPFLGFVCVFVCFAVLFWACFCCVCDFSFVMILSGKLLLFAIAFIIYHSVFCLSVVSGKACILVM